MITSKTEALLKSLFAVDENGNIYFRVTYSEDTAGKKLSNAVNTQSNRSLETLFSSAIVLDESGNPALNLAIVPFGSSKLEADKKRHKENEKHRIANEQEQLKIAQDKQLAFKEKEEEKREQQLAKAAAQKVEAEKERLRKQEIARKAKAATEKAVAAKAAKDEEKAAAQAKEDDRLAAEEAERVAAKEENDTEEVSEDLK